MIRLLFILVIAGIIGYIATSQIDIPTDNNSVSEGISADKKNNVVSANTDSSIFVPYWTIPEDTLGDEYTYYNYFGVAVTEDGLDISDPGYNSIADFLEVVGAKKKFLTIRMVDSSVNSAILKNRVAQQKIIEESLEVANKYNFDGVVLDLEMSSISFDAVTKRVSDFYKEFYTQTKKDQILFYTTIYGDTYYRVRPYDLKHIAQYSDQILIMAYDFHKSRGNPGPNFPLNGKATYGYDFTTMIQDFLKDVPPEKITIIFGMFGYDWKVDKDNKAVGNGIAKSLNEINATIVNTCSYARCTVSRHDISQETQATYIDPEGKKHIVWFEDEESVQAKKEYVSQLGIQSYSFWAFSYF